MAPKKAEMTAEGLHGILDKALLSSGKAYDKGDKDLFAAQKAAMDLMFLHRDFTGLDKLHDFAEARGFQSGRLAELVEYITTDPAAVDEEGHAQPSTVVRKRIKTKDKSVKYGYRLRKKGVEIAEVRKGQGYTEFFLTFKLEKGDGNKKPKDLDKEATKAFKRLYKLAVDTGVAVRKNALVEAAEFLKSKGYVIGDFTE